MGIFLQKKTSITGRNFKLSKFKWQHRYPQYLIHLPPNFCSHTKKFPYMEENVVSPSIFSLAEFGAHVQLLTVGVWMSALIVSGWIPRKCCPVYGAGLACEVCVWCVGLTLFGFRT